MYLSTFGFFSTARIVQRAHVLVTLCLFLCVSVSLYTLRHGDTKANAEVISAIHEVIHDLDETSAAATPNPLDGCLHVYVDVGSNRGIQVRKLFEPSLFPSAPVLDIFSSYFGPSSSRNQTEVCAVGFEPNPLHYNVLTSTSLAYQRCGWRAIFNLGVAAGSKHAKQVYSTRVGINDMGGRVKGIAEPIADGVMDDVPRKEYDVTVIRLASFLLDIVRTRKLPPSAEMIAPKVVMKLDIEGAEKEVVPDLVMSGALSVVDNIHFDWHIGNNDFKEQETYVGLRDAMVLLTRLGREHKLSHLCNMEMGDDETFGEVVLQLPQC